MSVTQERALRRQAQGPDNRRYRSAESVREPPDVSACNGPQAANYTMIETSNGAVLDVVYETGERMEATRPEAADRGDPCHAMRAGR
jgi:hypothetical protein